MKFRVFYDDQPYDGVNRLASIIEDFGIQVENLDGGDGFEEFEITCNKGPVEFMNWTLGGKCDYQCVDEDEWTLPDYMVTRKTYTTKEVYAAFIKM